MSVEIIAREGPSGRDKELLPCGCCQGTGMLDVGRYFMLRNLLRSFGEDIPLPEGWTERVVHVTGPVRFE